MTTLNKLSKSCVHHWLLGDSGTRVPGVCARCGATRVFDGTPPEWSGFVEQQVEGANSEVIMKRKRFHKGDI